MVKGKMIDMNVSRYLIAVAFLPPRLVLAPLTHYIFFIFWFCLSGAIIFYASVATEILFFCQTNNPPIKGIRGPVFNFGHIII